MTSEVTTPVLTLQEKWLSVREVAAACGVHYDTVLNWGEEGPSRFRFGKSYKYREVDVLTWMEERNTKWGN